jgi:hypothetical protein
VKRFFISSLVLPLLLCGQSSSVTSSTSVDVNGHRVTDGPQVTQTKSANGASTTETMQSINGRMVPLERVEERVVRDDASGRVVERLIRRYDPQGNPTPSVKQTIEVQKRSDGSSTTQTTTYRGDINGSLQLQEKTVTESRKSDSAETAETVIQRPTLNGSLETVEKESRVLAKGSGGYQVEATTYRRDGNGGFYTALKKSTQHTDQGSQATDNTAQYEADPSGQLHLQSQTVMKTTKQPDGSSESVVDIFGAHVPGTVDARGALKLQEQQIVQQKVSGSDTVQTLSVRRPTVSDPTQLGPARELSQTVCKGKCTP